MNALHEHRTMMTHFSLNSMLSKYFWDYFLLDIDIFESNVR